MVNPHTLFPLKNYRDASDDDTDLCFRAMVKMGGDTPLTSMFPPTQYRTTDNKHDFVRLLNQYLSDKNWLSVEVLQGGKHLYSFDK